jgi:hypothetical protein
VSMQYFIKIFIFRKQTKKENQTNFSYIGERMTTFINIWEPPIISIYQFIYSQCSGLVLLVTQQIRPIISSTSGKIFEKLHQCQNYLFFYYFLFHRCISNKTIGSEDRGRNSK